MKPLEKEKTSTSVNISNMVLLWFYLWGSDWSEKSLYLTVPIVSLPFASSYATVNSADAAEFARGRCTIQTWHRS
jgi:hypothetical protein